MIISIEEQQLNNLIVFLKRTSLTGEEVQSFNELVGIITKDVSEEYAKVEVKEEKPKK